MFLFSLSRPGVRALSLAQCLCFCQPESPGQRTYIFGAGGNQGGEGNDAAGEWFIENVKEELDQPNEYILRHMILSAITQFVLKLCAVLDADQSCF